MARVTELCKTKDRPLKFEDLAKIKLDRLEAAGAAPAAKAKAAPKAADPGAGEDRSDFKGQEAEVLTLATSIAYAPNPDEAKRLADQALALLNTWEPKKNNEANLTLWIEVWTRLGRQCLGNTMNANVGSKYALMCGIKGLGQVDATMPKFASKERLRWRGACHSLCGEVFARLVDPQKQEKESLLKLRRMGVEQFERCCEYAIETNSTALAIFGAKSLWNVALPLLHSAETRRILVSPLTMATRALAKVKYQEDPYFFAGLYSSLFDCYSDVGQWDDIHAMLGEAFAAVPSLCHRRLWALRMLALSRQGKNVAVAMGKMKESQAKAQASIWIVLARASSKKTDQLDAFTNAIRILQEAQQPDVVEVRLELADWLLRNQFEYSSAQEQLMAAAEVLLEIEEDPEDGDFDVDGDGADGASSCFMSEREDGSDGRSFRSLRSFRSGGKSDTSSARRATLKSKGRNSIARSRTSRSGSERGSDLRKQRLSRASGSARSSGGSSARSSKQRRAEEDQALSDQLYAHNYEALVRIYATNSRLTNGSDSHSALLAAAHFAVRFFANSVEMGNTAAQELAQLPPPEERKGSKASALDRKGSKISTVSGKIVSEVSILPPFAVPERLADWADQDVWPWCPSPVLGEVLSRAEREGIIGGDSCTWVGHTDVFAKPQLTFHTLCYLERDLEEHGYHLWGFPVLALHLQLADAFPSPVRDAIACLVYLRLSRFASECRLTKAAVAAAAKGNELLTKVRETFGSFGDELELARSQRIGRGMSDVLDPDWLDGAKLQNPVSAPWACNEFNIHEVWAEIGQECVFHGELWMGCKLAEEACMHAKVYGDRRAVRKVQLIQARLTNIEGKHDESARALKEIAAGDLEQTVELALMLAKVHQSKKSMVLSEQVLKSAMNAIKDAAKIAAGSNASPAGMSAFVRAESEISYALNLSEIGRLSTLSVTSRDWWTSLDAVFTLQREVSTKLHDSVLYRRDVVTFLIFARAIVSLLERKWSELDSNSSLSTTNNGILSCEALARYAKLLCDSATRCRSSRDALLSLAVPIEGVAEQSFSPPEVLAAKLDIWEARSASLHRDLVAAAKVEQSHAKRTRIVESAELVNASVMSLPERIAPAKVLCVARSWPEEDTGIDPVEQFAKDWVVEVDGKLSEADRQQSLARAASAVENSILVVSNAVTTLQSVYSDEEPSGTLDIVHPACEIDALVELGRLQLERAKQLAPLGTPSKWEEPVPDSREQQGMELGERYSMILQSRDPTEVYKLPAEVAAEAGADSIGLSEATEQEAKISEDMAKATLCEAVRKAIVSRHFSAAHRALKALGLEAFGVQCPEASFEFLVWLQSVDTCMRAEETYAELVEDDHQERVQMGLLQRLGSTWFDPTQLAAYQASVKRLCRDSPFFQRLRLADMPSINELLLSFLPPLTLVVIANAWRLYVCWSRMHTC
jgi:lipopolysaccharide biosynthesis regulator YciM